MNWSISQSILGGLLAVWLAGCAHTDATRFYLLASPAAATGAGPVAAARVGLLPVAIPVHLEVPQLVVRRTASELEVRDFHRWAEPLSTGVARALRDGMEAALGDGSVLLFPWPAGDSPATTVRVELWQFDGDLTGLVRLRALVQVRRPGDGLISTSLMVEEQAASSASADLVVAMSRSVGRLAAELAVLVRESADGSQNGGGDR